MTRSYDVLSPAGDLDTVTVTVPGQADIPVKVKQLTWTFDAAWTPYCQAELVAVQLTGAQATALDPRAGLRARFTARQVIDGTTTTRLFNLCVRARRLNWVSGEVTLTLASDEALALDYGWLNTQSPQVSGNIMAIVRAYWPLSNTIASDGLTSGQSSQQLTDPGWPPGQSLWDHLAPFVEGVGAWMYCDEAAVFHVTDPNWAGLTTAPAAGGSFDPGARSLTDATAIIDIDDVINRDDPMWATDAVLALSNGTYVPSTPQQNSSAQQKTLRFDRNVSTGWVQAADKVAANARKRGRLVTATASADIVAAPNQAWTFGYGDQSRAGVMQAVSVNLLQGQMTATLKATN